MILCSAFALIIKFLNMSLPGSLHSFLWIKFVVLYMVFSGSLVVLLPKITSLFVATSFVLY